VAGKWRVVDYKRFDELTKDGSLANRYVIISPLRKRVFHVDYKRFEDDSPVNMNERSPEFWATDYIPQKHPLYPNPSTNVTTTIDSTSQPIKGMMVHANNILKFQPKSKISPLKLQNTMVIQMDVGGNTMLFPSQSIHVTFPSEVEGENDKRLSGTWSTIEIEHTIDPKVGGYVNSVMIARDGVSIAESIMPDSTDTKSNMRSM